MKYVPDKCVFRNVHTINNNHLFIIMALTKPLDVLMKGPMLICFSSLKGSTLKKIPFFSSLHLSRTSHEYNLCILAMFTMSHKDVKYVNWPNLGVLNLRVGKGETRKESADNRCFPDDIL